MTKDRDVCIIGSGAGESAVVWSLPKAGYSVVVLEKGPWLREADVFRDELACCRRSGYTPEPQAVELEDQENGGWNSTPTPGTDRSLWNGNLVGSSSNCMSGFFHRPKPVDLRLLSELGPVAGANVADWPIDYDDLEPYYDLVEKEVGVSGRVVEHPHQKPRSSPGFPFPPTAEHPISALIDRACEGLGCHSIPTPRAILPHAALDRNGCS